MAGRARSACAAAAALILANRAATADDNDLVLSRLADVVEQDGGREAIGDSRAFRALASELGVVLAPRLAEPADTLGFGGFALTADVAFTDISADAAHWRVLESSPAPGGSGIAHGDRVMTTVGVFAKKGLGLPLPAIEIGVGAVHLLRSRTWAGQAYAKLALHEGYHAWPLPSLAVRGGVSRMMGQSDLNLTVGSLDAVLSKDVGVGGTFTLSPYVGWDWLLVVARSELIDATPEIDAVETPADRGADFVFVDQDVIQRHRVVAGAKLTYGVVRVGLEAAVALAGRSTDDREGTSMTCGTGAAPTTACDAPDDARRQTTVTVTIGSDF